MFSRRKSHLATAVLKRFEWVIFSQPRGDRGATMEEGEVQIFFLIATIILFLSRNSSAR